jgi:transcriptional regulator with XRE-family HTH domain
VSVAEQFGRNLAHCRRQAELSQGELGVLASLHSTAIGLFERGQRLPRIDTLIKLAVSLEVTPDELLDGIAWKPGELRPGGFADAAGPET